MIFRPPLIASGNTGAGADVGSDVMSTRPPTRPAAARVSGARYGGTNPVKGRTDVSVAVHPRPVGTRTGTGHEVERDARGGRQMVVLRREIGDVLRDARQRQRRTLREVSSAARVSLGYLSEVERGQKEASSELLGSICDALDVPMSLVLREVSDRIAVAERLLIPDTIPFELTASLDGTGDAGWARARAELAPIG